MKLVSLEIFLRGLFFKNLTNSWIYFKKSKWGAPFEIYIPLLIGYFYSGPGISFTLHNIGFQGIKSLLFAKLIKLIN
jgi:hypothetical protein